MDLSQLIDNASATVSGRVDTVEGHLGVLDALLCCYGDYGITLGCIALFTPKIQVNDKTPLAFFPGSDEPLPIDCFHVDLLHHSNAENRNPEVFRALGEALAMFWTQSLERSNQPGYFQFDESNGYDVVFCI